MKNIYKFISMAVTIVFVITACNKVEDLPFYSNGTQVALSSSKTSVALTAADSATKMVTFSWTSPDYKQDTSLFKYILEIDSAGKNFSKEKTVVITGRRDTSLTGKQLNDIVAGFGYAPGQTYGFDIRITSSYGNNNERLMSNVIKLSIAPYLVPVTLTPTPTGPFVLQVTNATNTAVTFNWNASPYGANTIYYALQIDKEGGNFSQPQVFKYGSSLTSKLTVSELNSAAIAVGVIGGTTKNIECRIVTYSGTTYTTPLVYSNTVKLNVTTFTPVPATLYIVGDATPGGWSNPVPTPSQQFTRLDDVSYSIVINLTAGKSYVFLPVNGSWDHKYGGTSATGGQLLADGAVPGSNTPAPATSGNYQIIVNFQTGTYAVTPFTNTIPANLFIVGDATDGGWSNPVPVPSQQFTKIDAVSFGIVVHLTAGKSYLFLPVNGSWDHKYGGTSATGGTLLADGAVPGSNTPAPATTGNYQIIVNFQANTYTVTPYGGPFPLPTNLYIVGDATPGGWSNPVPVPSQQFSRINLTQFQLTLPLTTGKSYLFLPLNGNWDHKFGGASATGGPLLADGAVPGSNTPAPATSGNYNIIVDFLANTYKVVQK
jgi:hypothetical protein